jgi:hypothetical protein
MTLPTEMGDEPSGLRLTLTRRVAEPAAYLTSGLFRSGRSGGVLDHVREMSACRRVQGVESFSRSVVYDHVEGAAGVGGSADARVTKPLLDPLEVLSIVSHVVTG